MKVLAVTLVQNETSVAAAISALSAMTMIYVHRAMKLVQQHRITQQAILCSVFSHDQTLSSIMVVNH